MARIGYARVSTIDQDLDTQLTRLKSEGCDIVRSEKVSGATREGRTELATVLEFLRTVDELVVTRLDRLGRDTRDVLNLVHECEAKGASVTVLDPFVSTKGQMGHVVLTVLGMVAQMERRFIKERQREGIEQAKRNGRYKGVRRASTLLRFGGFILSAPRLEQSPVRSAARECRSTALSGRNSCVKGATVCALS